MKRLALFILAFALATGAAAVAGDASSTANRFVHASGKYLVDPEGHTLQLRGINLGNWLVPEGYMFGLDGGPALARTAASWAAWSAFSRCGLTTWAATSWKKPTRRP